MIFAHPTEFNDNTTPTWNIISDYDTTDDDPLAVTVEIKNSSGSTRADWHKGLFDLLDEITDQEKNWREKDTKEV